MEKDIQQQLAFLEESKNIKILLAVESGSRAWGFPSPDSDYDVRIIYLASPEWYLSIDDHKDTIEYFHGDLLDISGWDLRKSLRLLRKSNATPMEWAQSPIVYQQANDFCSEILDLAALCFNPAHTFHHYVGIAQSTFQGLNFHAPIKLKKLFYVIRPLLAAKWIDQHQQIPPMDISKLFAVLEGNPITEFIKQLIELKQTVDESYQHQFAPDLPDYLKMELDSLKSVDHFQKIPLQTTGALNDFFRAMLAKYFP